MERDESTHHSVYRLDLNQRIIKHLSQVSSLSLAQFAEVVNQRRIKQTEFLAHALQVGTHVIQTVLPELAHKEPTLTMRLVHLSNEVSQEVLAEMLYGIETNTLERDLFAEPDSPIENIFNDFRMRVVEISEHEVIIVAFLGIDIVAISPAFCLVSENLIDGSLVVFGVVVSAGEMVPVVFLLGVFGSSAGEIESQPGIDLVGVGDGLVSVIGVDFLGFAFLLVVCSGLVV